MDDLVLWAMALGIGVLGLLLLAVAGLAAVYLNVGRREARAGHAAGESPVRARDVPAADRAQAHAQPSHAVRNSSVRIWTWIKAAVFAFIHAGAVSFVLGGVTFFEDLVRASDEMQDTGTVTFPRQLLPGTLSGANARKPLSQSSGDSLASQYQRYNVSSDRLGDLDRPGPPPPETLGWEVVDLMEEADSDANGLVGDFRSGS